MRPISLSVKNLASYKNETLNYDDVPDISCITGKNGAGKSSFFVDAITIALFNQARCTDSKGTGMENLISTNEDTMEVAFVFESDGSEIKVIRRRFTKGGQELELYIDGVSHTDKIKETQTKLNNIIKMDYDTFLDTVCIGQGESGRFMKKKPDERKEVFTQVLGLDKYDVLQEYTKELRKDLNDKIKRNKADLEELSEVIGEKQRWEQVIISNEEKVEVLNSDLEQKQEELEKEIVEKSKYEQIKNQRDEVILKRNTITNKIKSIKDSLDKGKSILESLQETILLKDKTNDSLQEKNETLLSLQQEITNLTSNKSSLETKNEFLTNAAKEIKTKYTRLKDYNEADCSFCGQNITEEHKNKHLNDMATEGKRYLSEINQNKQTIDTLSDEILDNNQKTRQLRAEITQLQSKKSEIEQAETKLQGVIQRLSELSEDLKERESDLEEVMKTPIKEVEERTFKDGQIRIEINNIKNDLTDAQNKVAVAKSKITDIGSKAGKVKKIEDETKSLTEEVALLDELVVAFGKDGIQAIIIDNALPEIQEEINKFLGILTDERVTVEFVTQKEKGKGKKTRSIETLDIVINDEYGSRTYETYSGGEKFRVDFSCHVGLAKFLAKRAGSSVKFFIVDEGIGSQDEVAKEQFIKASHQLTTIFDKVMVITHIPDIIDSFNNKIEVYKNQIDGSKIRIIS